MGHALHFLLSWKPDGPATPQPPTATAQTPAQPQAPGTDTAATQLPTQVLTQLPTQVPHSPAEWHGVQRPKQPPLIPAGPDHPLQASSDAPLGQQPFHAAATQLPLELLELPSTLLEMLAAQPAALRRILGPALGEGGGPCGAAAARPAAEGAEEAPSSPPRAAAARLATGTDGAAPLGAEEAEEAPSSPPPTAAAARPAEGAYGPAPLGVGGAPAAVLGGDGGAPSAPSTPASSSDDGASDALAAGAQAMYSPVELHLQVRRTHIFNTKFCAHTHICPAA